MPKTKIDGFDCNWSDNAGDGTNPLPLCFLHCSLASMSTWRGVTNHFAQRRWIALDLPGHGGTELDDRTDMQTQSQTHLAALLKEPHHLVGHSFGGVMALRFALQNPDKVKALTLYEPVLIGVLDDANHPHWQTHCKRDAKFLRYFERDDLKGAARDFLRRWGGPGGLDVMPKPAQAEVISHIRLMPSGGDFLYNATPSRTSLSQIKTIMAPSTLVAGSRSDETGQATAQVIGEALPNGRFEALDGAGHMAPITDAPRFAEAIIRTEQRIPIQSSS